MGVQINGDTGNISATKADYSGNVTIGGTLTYEDVTNVDSIGLVTARNGIEVGASPGVAASISVDGNMIVSGISTFGGDVQVPDKIIHAGDTNTAIRFPAADALTIETGGSETFRITGAGATISTNNSNDSELTVEGTGGATVHLKDSGSGEHFRLSANGQASLYAVSSHPMVFYTGGVASSNERLRIGTSGQIGIAGANYGTDGQVLTSKGSSAAVQWASPTIYTEYSTQTASGANTYSITMSNDPKVFEVSLFELRHGVSANIMYRLSNSGGETTSGYYDISSYFKMDHSSNSTSRGLNQSQGCLVNYDFTGADNLMNGKAVFTKVNTGLYTFSGSYAMYFHADASNNDQYRIKSDGHIDNNQNSGSTVTQIRIFTSNGANFTGGSINVRGIA